MKKAFKSEGGEIPLPVFFPDATRAVLKTLDSLDLKATKTPGILVNTYHLWQGLDPKVLEQFGGIREFMGFEGGVISDSGGFQVMSVIKKNPLLGKITDEGIVMWPGRNKRVVFAPEDSIAFQMKLKSDMVVVLDDFTPPDADLEMAKDTVRRTIEWAKRSKAEFERQCKKRKLGKKERPYLLGVVQGGFYEDLRRFCAQELIKIGFDGFGYGGWPILNEGGFDYRTARVIAEETPADYLLYGLGIGKPDEVVKLARMGYQIFDCVLPTRDARHKRLYVYKADSIEEIDLEKEDFWEYYSPDKDRYRVDDSPVSPACDCLLCTKYSRAYLAHLWKIGDMSAYRLSTIHNLRFYSILMEKLRVIKTLPEKTAGETAEG